MSRSKLVSHRTTVTLSSGTTITTLHLTPEAKAGLSTNGVEIPAPDRKEPTMHNHPVPGEDCPACRRNDRFWSVTSAVLGAAMLIWAIVESCR